MTQPLSKISSVANGKDHGNGKQPTVVLVQHLKEPQDEARDLARLSLALDTLNLLDTATEQWLEDKA